MYKQSAKCANSWSANRKPAWVKVKNCGAGKLLIIRLLFSSIFPGRSADILFMSQFAKRK